MIEEDSIKSSVALIGQLKWLGKVYYLPGMLSHVYSCLYSTE